MKKISTLSAAVLMAFASIVPQGCSSPSNGLESVDLLPVKTTKEGKWSMINKNGEIVYDSEFKNRPTAAYNGIFSVEEGKGYSVYNISDKNPQLIEGLENLKSVGCLVDGLLPVTFPGKRISIVDKNGKLKFELDPIQGVEIIRCDPGYSDGLLRVYTEDDKVGFVDKSGNTAVKPIYDEAFYFSEGLAIVGQKNESDGSNEYTVSAIDKTGKEVFKIKEDYKLITGVFQNGYIVAKKDDRIYLINKKGEETKLSSKIASISDYNDKYIIFENEEGEFGVADFKDEIIIRPKYYGLHFGLGDFFLARKDSDSKEIIKLDANGDESKDIIDYKEVYALGQFGYLAKDGKTYLLLDEDFKPKGKEEFFDYSVAWSNGLVYTDYFSAADVAKTIVGMFDGDKVAGLALGSPASKVLNGKKPQYYTYRTSVDFDDLNKTGFRYNIKVSGTFSETIADYNWNYSNYSTNYYWNPSSKLSSVYLYVNCEAEWSKSGSEAITLAFKNAGYRIIKDGTNENAYVTAFKKGKLLIVAYSIFDGKSAIIYVADTSLHNSEFENNILDKIKSAGENDIVTEEVAAVDADSVIADSTVIAE